MMEFLLLFIFVMVGVAFITLLERKILGYIQLRVGPNKLFLLGLFQPLADALKLFTKEKSVNYSSNKILFSLFPMLSLVLMLMMWFIFYWPGSMNMNYSFLYFLVISGLGVYVILGCGWASNSKYSLLGAYRGVAQTVSYEVSMAFVMACYFITVSSFNMKSMYFYNLSNIYLVFSFLLLFIFWLVVLLAEVNRAPFDFAEGESELVSGFNVEYGAGNFALLFLAEYGNIFFMSYVTIFIFFGWSCFLTIFLISFVIWVRGTYPRYRYDNLMMLTWKTILPFSVFYFCFCFSLNLL